MLQQRSSVAIVRCEDGEARLGSTDLARQDLARLFPEVFRWSTTRVAPTWALYPKEQCSSIAILPFGSGGASARAGLQQSIG